MSVRDEACLADAQPDKGGHIVDIPVASPGHAHHTGLLSRTFPGKVYSPRLPHVTFGSCEELRDVGRSIKMSEMKSDDPASEEERDWVAAKAFFENLKTNKPRPVRLVSECSLT